MARRAGRGSTRKPAGAPEKERAPRSPRGRTKGRAGGAERKASRPAGAAPGATRAPAIEHVGSARELFWQNILRELLMSLSILSAQRAGAAPPGGPTGPATAGGGELSGVVPQVLGEGAATSASGEDDEDDGEDSAPGELGSGALVRAPAGPPNLFDGRLAVITTLGQRIAIGSVEAVFACNIPAERGWLASAVECSVFQITTPEGEVFTLPLSEVRAFHSLTPELMEKLEKTAQEQVEPEKDVPFGFAAFRSLSSAGKPGVPELDPESWGE